MGYPNRFLRAGLLSALLLPVLQAGSWPEIPADTWKLQASAYPGQPGAVVLLDRYAFRKKVIERFRRVLVLGTSGRDQGELKIMGATVKRLEGRVVLPDQKVIPLVSGVDLLKVNAVQYRGEWIRESRVIPAGVTDHCLIDLRWEEPLDDEDWPIPTGYGLSWARSLSADVPVRAVEMFFDSDIADTYWKRKLEASKDVKVSEQNSNGKTLLRIEDIPARPRGPFACASEVALPIFHWYYLPPLNQMTAELGVPPSQRLTILDGAAIAVQSRSLVESDRYRITSALRLELKALGQGLKTSASLKEQTRFLISALRHRVKVVENAEDLAKSPLPWQDDLMTALQRGWGSPYQLRILGFHLLREHGIPVNLMDVSSRFESWATNLDDLWQFEYRLLLVSNGSEGDLILDPASSTFAFGTPAPFQGTRATVYRPGPTRKDWRGSLLTVPVAPPSAQEQTWEIQVTSDGDHAAYRFSLEAGGSWGALWKQRVGPEASGDARRALAPQFNRGGFNLTEASHTLSESQDRVKIKGSGLAELEGGRRPEWRPFLLVDPPIPTPELWPEPRTVSIQLPATASIRAKATLPWKAAWAVPEGSWKQNAIGSVRWTADRTEDGQSLQVDLTIQVRGVSYLPSVYEDLQRFTGWTREALSLSLKGE